MTRIWLLALLVLAVSTHAQLGHTLSFSVQWHLLVGTQTPEAFAEYLFLHAQLPRTVMAVLVGVALAVAGSLMQQLLQNRLVSPMTLGASSGAWLALLVGTLWLPALTDSYSGLVAFIGALTATLLAFTIAGPNGLAGLPIVLAGMALSLLFGALATGLTLIHDQYSRDLFIWGAGDLGQTGWVGVQVLIPQVLIAISLTALAPRALTLLRLGNGGASARGLTLWPVMAGFFLLALWLTASAIAAVGLIGFIGLLTPNLARFAGARTAGDELFNSALLGAALLLLTDCIAQTFSNWSHDLVPSGAAAALIGAPTLLWLIRQRLRAEDQVSLTLPGHRSCLQRRHVLALTLLTLAAILAAICVSPTPQGWAWGWPEPALWSLRWPRLLTAAGAGMGLAMAGVILQRLLRNPLASPDILGISAGASLALVSVVIFTGQSIFQAGPIVALLGSLLILAILVLLGKRHQYAPSVMALTGIALAAFVDAVLQFVLAKGTQEAFAILGWLSGSTYRATPPQAISLLMTVIFAGLLTLLCHRALTLMAAGDGIAQGRGLHLSRMRILLLVLVGVFCASVTAVMGPVAFVGLLAPHMATLMGARRVVPQLLLAAHMGGLLMLCADWLGRVLLYPTQLPAGLIAAVIGGGYFISLLLLTRRRPTSLAITG